MFAKLIKISFFYKKIINNMARNTGNGSRKGTVIGRSQIFNPTTGHYIKRDTETGMFIDVKTDGTAFKGIRKEAVLIRANPNLNKNIAIKAENAVLKIRNRTK